MASKKVILKGSGIRNEDDAGGTVTPGHLLEYSTATAVVVHSVIGGNASAMFAVENDFVGSGMDVDYASGERVQHETLHQGMQVNALVAAGAPAISVGDFLESAGDGTLKGTDELGGGGSPLPDGIPTSNIVARALEAIDNSGGAAAVRIIAEIV